MAIARKYLFLLIATAVCVLCGCRKEDDPVQSADLVGMIFERDLTIGPTEIIFEHTEVREVIRFDNSRLFSRIRYTRTGVSSNTSYQYTARWNGSLMEVTYRTVNRSSDPETEGVYTMTINLGNGELRTRQRTYQRQ